MRTPAFLPPERAEASRKGHFAAGAPMTTELREVLRCRTVLAWPIHAGNPLDRLRLRAALGPATTGTTTLRVDRLFRALPSRADECSVLARQQPERWNCIWHSTLQAPSWCRIVVPNVAIKRAPL